MDCFRSSVDIKSAFDNLSPSVASRVFQDRGVPTGLIAAFMAQGVGLQIDPSFVQIDFSETDPVDFSKSLRQGGKESIFTWDSTMLCLLAPLAKCLAEEGYGIMLGEENSVMLTHAVWADNIWLFATSLQQLQTMLNMLTQVLVDFLFFGHLLVLNV